MDYFISSNAEATCPDDFPERLSFFLEQIGGYDEYSEVAQVATILNINLDAFQHLAYPEEEDEEEEDTTAWQDIEEFTTLVENFIARIEANPAYYKQVIHNPNYQQQHREIGIAFDKQDVHTLLSLLEIHQQTPQSLYPPDYEYLSSGALTKDLFSLLNILKCYKENGATKIQLTYM